MGEAKRRKGQRPPIGDRFKIAFDVCGVAALFLTPAGREPEHAQIRSAVWNIAHAIDAAPAGKGPLCMLCPAELNGETLAHGIAVHMQSVGREHAFDDGDSMVSVICGPCTANDDWQMRLVEAAGSLFGSDMKITVPPSSSEKIN